MGLLDRIERKQSEMEIPKNVYFEYESMTDEIKKEILRFWKRLFIRGVLGAAEEYCEKCNICVRDKENDVICFKQGKTAEVHYFGLWIKNEMWTVSGILDKNDKTENFYSDIQVLYVPSKIGKVSKVDDKVLEIARNAVDMLRNENLKEYTSNLSTVLSEDCVKEYIEMSTSWYEQIFEDENCRQLRDYQLSKMQAKKDIGKVIEFEYQLVDKTDLVTYQSVISEKITSNRFVFEPKICVKVIDEEIRCFKYLKNAETGVCDDIQYYVLLINSEVLLVGAIENKETGDVSIEKISIFGDGQYNEDVLQKTAGGAILKIQETWYNSPDAKCADTIHMERHAYNKQIEI